MCMLIIVHYGKSCFVKLPIAQLNENPENSRDFEKLYDLMPNRETTGSLFSRFQNVFVFVNGGTADVADSRQFADAEMSLF